MSNRRSPAPRYLIVNADDFGQSAGITAGVIEAHERGIVTSASLMVRWPASGAAAAYAREHPQLSVGMHVDLAEHWYDDGEWRPRYEVVATDDAGAVQAEVERQLARFRDLLGRDPTHLDSHQHVHRADPVATAMREVAERLAVPLRDANPRVTYRGDFYGQSRHGEHYHDAIGPGSLISLLRALPPGYTELGCHPALVDDLDTTYATERLIELETLCDPAVRRAVEEDGIELRSFHDVLRRQ